ncbi:hypothetical protein [Cupriavidus sp. RAF12]|uniref:hypothetical protein n=1 Tax=Cupriavidus sp. RAF12 TaxID=3233050 RepID=UPI003F8F52CA
MVRFRFSRRGPVCALLLAALTLGACSMRTRVNSSRAPEYEQRPTRIYVVTGAQMGYGRPFATAFRAKFQELASQCGVEAQFESPADPALDQAGQLARASANRANAVLRITGAAGSATQSRVVFGATLDDVRSSRNAWRGSFTFERGHPDVSLAERGMVFAADVSNSLKKDGILAGCSMVSVGRDGRIDPTIASVQRTPAAAAASPAGTARVANLPPGTPVSPGGTTLRDLQDLLPARE